LAFSPLDLEGCALPAAGTRAAGRGREQPEAAAPERQGADPIWQGEPVGAGLARMREGRACAHAGAAAVVTVSVGGRCETPRAAGAHTLSGRPGGVRKTIPSGNVNASHNCTLRPLELPAWRKGAASVSWLPWRRCSSRRRRSGVCRVCGAPQVRSAVASSRGVEHRVGLARLRARRLLRGIPGDVTVGGSVHREP
jgi:hypothetical protein